jgi:hypothetical protein
MSRNHLAAIVVGFVLLATLWAFVVPLLLDLGERSSSEAGLGWLVLVGATAIVGAIMFRPPGFDAEGEATKIRKRQGLRRTEIERRRRGKSRRNR